MTDIATTLPDARCANGDVTFETDGSGFIRGATPEQAEAAAVLGILAPPAPASTAEPAPDTTPTEVPEP